VFARRLRLSVVAFLIRVVEMRVLVGVVRDMLDGRRLVVHHQRLREKQTNTE